jgi:predicted amidohydrolase YtcJ
LLDAIRAGQRSIEHIREALLLCFTDDPEELASFFVEDRWREDDVAWATPIYEQCPQVIEALNKNDVWLTPTLVVEHAKVAIEEDTFTQDARRGQLPISVREAFDAYVLSKRGQAPIERASEHLWWRTQQRLVRRMNEVGAKILAGTDAACEGGLPGFSLHTELELLVEAGLSPLKAIQAATLSPARYFGAGDSMGIVVPGALADLLLLNSNPLDDISNTRDIYATVFDGHLLFRVELDTLLQMTNSPRSWE